MAIKGNACLLLLGAIAISAIPQNSKVPVLPESRQRAWSSFGFRPLRIQENRVSERGQQSAGEFPSRNWLGGAEIKNGHSGILLNENSEKLSAVAVAGNEYMGTRAVAYAGFTPHHHHHHRQHHHHHQGHQEKGEFFTSGYQQTVTTAPQAAGGSYTKHHSGRRVCSRQAPSSVAHHRGRQIRLVYTEFPTGFSCCPGWTQVTRLSFGCNKPACSTTCLNGGTCIAPGKCTCPKQFTGQQCQFDVDECLTEKPCAQICQNTYGGYKCSCRTGFQLQLDTQSCRKNDSDDTAFEARDLETDYRTTTTRTSSTIPQDTENEVGDRDFDKDYEFILKRLGKLEKLIARSKRRDVGATEMSAKINLAVENIRELERAVESVRIMQREVYDLRNKLTHFEEESSRMEHIASRMTDLETRLRIYCSGSFNGNGRGIC